jgi:predicted ArsR family transcriptional regulator
MLKRDKVLERQIESVVTLGDPNRRALYIYVLGQEGDVSRDQAARALGLARPLAAFHLDKLAEAGLLEVSYRRLGGRSGPGAGRTSKLYRRSSKEIEVTLPARSYELAARLLVDAVEQGGSVETLERVAEEWGRKIGRQARDRAGDRADRARLTRSMLDALRRAGFEPRRAAEGDVVLGNCPFKALRSGSSTMICRMNLALCRGLVAGLEAPWWSVRFEPEPGRCCAVFQSAGSSMQ